MHAYQHENNEDLLTVNAEVTAYIFAEGVKFSLGYGGTTPGTETEIGKVYERANWALISGMTFNLETYYKALDTFKDGSKTNDTGLYRKQKVIKPDENPLIKKFFPLMK